MRIREIAEAFNVGKMPDITHDEYQSGYGPLIKRANKIAQVRANLELYRYQDRIYLLVKDSNLVVGNVTLATVEIAGKQYLNIAGIFVDPVYRKTSAAYWLIYAVKEALDQPVIADGAIFADGQKLIRALQKHRYLNIGKINTDTGEITDLGDGMINSMNHAYIFTNAKLGFGSNIFEGTGLPYVWYPLFDELL